ncbi:ead/Ea22-like family protein [Escherichia coli]|uniref:ead/Ea22-like family protein n=1 Tax=Escherichia coli TaxID=562 RepID=UPI003F008643
MSKIDYQALRAKAEKATCGVWSLEYGEERFDAGDALIHREVVGYLPICRIEGAHPESGFDEDFQIEQQANAEFIAAANPATVLALLDELERNQQYIKRRDQENEEIALTVGRLRVELEAAENNLIDSECHVAELEEALRDKQALLEASEKRIAELESEPVSQTYKSQHTQFEQVADLYEMQFDDGRTCAFHTDAQKAAQWLQACDGNRVQEYVKLERLRNALSGNYPVTPDGWISCSERMPDDAQWCVVDAADGYYVQCWSKGQGWLGDDISLRNCDVIRWMAIPEPPEQDGE